MSTLGTDRLATCEFCRAVYGPRKHESSGAFAKRRFCSRACASASLRVDWTRTEILGRVEIDEDGCWLWKQGISQTGYARVSARGKSRDAHRYFYEILVGAVPDGLFLDHACHSRDKTCPGNLCKHRRCINPDHLEPVTHTENVRRGVRGREVTHCPQGHTYEGWNLILDSGRHCRTCMNARGRAYRKRKRDAA